MLPRMHPKADSARYIDAGQSECARVAVNQPVVRALAGCGPFGCRCQCWYPSQSSSHSGVIGTGRRCPLWEQNPRSRGSRNLRVRRIEQLGNALVWVAGSIAAGDKT